MTVPYYDPQTPENTDTLEKSQPTFLENFQSLFATFAINHLSLTDPEKGTHNVIQLLEQESGLQTNTNELNIYSKQILDSDGNRTQTDQIFLRYQGNGLEIQITNYQIYDLGNLQYFTMLPGGFLIYFGILPSMKSGSTFTLKPTPKTIVSSAFSPNGISTKKAYPPFVKYDESNKDLPNVDRITFFTAAPSITPTIFSQFYLVVGNFA